MKLELKHLAPYLPYGLKTINYNTSGFLNKPLISEVIASNILSFIDCSTQSKIILRPLSDLTKEIEVNGLKINPIVNLNAQGYNMNFDDKFTFEDFIKTNFLNNSYGFINLLIKWHFDVFGLIENGLAIDINTLNG